MRRDESLIIKKNDGLASGVFHLTLKRNPAPVAPPAPGQFAMVQVREGASPLLRRPLSYLFGDENTVEFLYRVTGVGTRILANTKPGDVLNVLGPLGRGFDSVLAKDRAMLVAGGTGLPPLHFLARVLNNGGVNHVDLVYGAASADELVLGNSIGSGLAIHYATEDGSKGFKGLATDLMKDMLQENAPDVIYACGPYPMLKALADIARESDIPCQVSVEARMACGVGACLGCAISTSNGKYLQVCDDGPVFDANALFPGEPHA